MVFLTSLNKLNPSSLKLGLLSVLCNAEETC